MPVATRAEVARVRSAISFVRFLRNDADSYNDHYSRRIRDFWEASERDEQRFGEVVELISGEELRWCDECGRPTWEWTGRELNDTGPFVCEHWCIDRYYWCDVCERWYHPENENHDHEPEETGSVCEARHLDFTFPALGTERGQVANDERFVLRTAGGVIAQEGLVEMHDYLDRQHGYYDPRCRIFSDHVLYDENFSREWVTKEGNFTKRLAKLYLQKGLKLTPAELSAIGNIARRHCSKDTERAVELTRDLNLSAGDFYHSASCWWTSESRSRCILKRSGGLALRTFSAGEPKQQPECGRKNCTQCPMVTVNPGKLTGRAWVLPLAKDTFGTLKPTEDTDADAYMVFNVYGLDGWEAARMVAQMTGRSYKRIAFDLRGAYINNGRGYLVAAQQLCDRTDGLTIDGYNLLDCECVCEG